MGHTRSIRAGRASRWCSSLLLAAAAMTAGCGVATDDAGAGGGPSGVARTERAVTRPPTTRRVAVLLLHYGQPLAFGPDYYRGAFFTNADSVHAFYLDATHGAVSFEGDVFGWMPTQRSAGCEDMAAIEANAVAAAQAAGINLGPYDHVAIVLADSCRNGGQAELGSPNHPARYTVFWSAISESVFAHELAHNLGLAHALGWSCGTTTMGTPAACAESNGSPADPMGIVQLIDFNAYNQTQEGWLDGCNVMTAPAGGDFTLAPVELGTAALQALRVPVANALCPPQTGTPCYYYVEYRQPAGWDARFPDSPFFHGATIYLGGEIDRNAIGHPSELLDTHPSAAGLPPNFFDATLLVGETFTDPNGVRIRAVSDAGQQLVVHAEVPGGTGGAACLGARVAASLSVSSQSATSYCGELTIRNVSTTLVTDWRVDIDMRQSTLTTSWNSIFTAQGGSRYAVTPPPWNHQITAGNAIGVGFCAQKTGANFLPLILSATGS